MYIDFFGLNTTRKELRFAAHFFLALPSSDVQFDTAATMAGMVKRLSKDVVDHPGRRHVQKQQTDFNFVH